METLFFIAIGVLTGFVSEKLLKGIRVDLSVYIIMAVIGSLCAGQLTLQLHFTFYQDKFLMSILSSLAGSISMIVLIYLFHNID
ncbi:MAG: hypothetical protein E6772_02230 [Dysgonomonas sp.]|nr:hypothetical protein [Dysgonomonas sp.]